MRRRSASLCSEVVLLVGTVDCVEICNPVRFGAAATGVPVLAPPT